MTKRTCDLPECERPHMARGLCSNHYRMAARDGWLPPIIPKPNFTVDHETGCWLWAKARSDTGYGVWRHEGTTHIAHRLMFELVYGPIPEGYQLDHLCRTPLCVNPDHLDPVTPSVNQMRGHGPASVNGRKTHCVHGHEYTPENTYLRPDRKGRQCRVCIHERSVRLAATQKAERARRRAA